MEQTKSVGIWIRVSTEDQVESESPEHHEKRARMYAEAKGWRVAEVYHLEAVSGKSVIEHPEAKRMLKHIREGRITGLIFSKLARLARNTKELLEFADFFRDHDADLISIAESIDTSTPAGRLFYTMIAAMAQWEREEIASRVLASVSIRAKLGKSLGAVAPYGYRWEKKELVADEKESPVRKLMYDLYLEHKRKIVVAKTLNEKGYRTRNGALFCDRTVERLLRDPVAKGTRRVNYTQSLGKGKTWVEKPSDQWVLQKVPALISEETWQACQTILDAQAANHKPKGKRSAHLFTGLLRCECGGKMYIPPRSANYVCHTCRKTKVPKDDIEEIYFEQLKEYLLSKQDIRTFQTRGEDAIRGKEQERSVLSDERGKVKADMDKLVGLHLGDQMPTERFREYFNPLDERIRQIDNELIDLEGQVDFLRVQLMNGEYILGNAETLYEKWPTLTRNEKRQTIEDLTDSIVIGNDEITIQFTYTPQSFQNMQNSQRDLTLALVGRTGQSKNVQ